MAPREIRRANSQTGITYLELVVVILLISTLIGVALTRLLPYVTEAERVALLRLEGQLRSVLTLEAARRIAAGQSRRLAELDHANPMALVFEPPASYLGEFASPNVAELPRRSWHFNTVTRRLVYRAGRGLEIHEGEPAVREYTVRVVFDDGDGDGIFTPGADDLQGVRLAQIQNGPESPQSSLAAAGR